MGWGPHGDTATLRHCDTATRPRGDTATRRHGDTATRRHGDGSDAEILTFGLVVAHQNARQGYDIDTPFQRV
jgi:hypothetical protein